MEYKMAIGIMIIIIIVAGALIYTVTSPQKESQETTEKYTIRTATLQGGISTLDIIEQNNLLESTGYGLKVLRLQKTPDIIAALANNETDLVVVPAEMAAKLIEQGGDYYIVAVDMLQNQAILVVDNNITSPADLTGKLVGAVVASGTYKVFKAYMQTVYNLTVVESDQPQPGVVSVVNVPPGSIIDALLNKQVDAVVIWEPLVSIGVTKGAKILVSFSELWQEAGLEGQPVMLVWLARGDFVENHPDALEAFLEARSQAAETWINDMQETKQIIVSLYNLDDATFNTMYNRTVIVADKYLSDELIDSIRTEWWLAWKGGYLEQDPANIPDTVFYKG
ncbi:MAG: ABC transporter substrate-binding protein [Desulfurococcales archaeon]|nr:ABC transporter substrate-binding protein [Desulfurococcales archaeon]